jgi:hypothetical protein
MNSEDDEFNRIEREAKQRMAAVKDTIRYRDAFPKDYRLPKPWVGLTDREMMDAINIDDSPMTMGRKIEAKLREKNS